MSKFLKIGVMDSGFGGLSVLNELSKKMQSADLIYYGDLVNSPYGEKSKEEVILFVEQSIQFFLEKSVDAILLACNTATSVSADYLRKKYSVPIFGMEPAIKPAMLENPNEKIAVLATPLTLKEKKFLDLGKSLEQKNRLYPIACENLSKLIDQAKFSEIEIYLKPILQDLMNQKINTIVLGCTHYVLIKNLFLSSNPFLKIYDGNLGTVNHMEKTLVPFPLEREPKLDLFLNGGNESDFEIAFTYLNNNLQNEGNYVK
jgi:glutamate racemase